MGNGINAKKVLIGFFLAVLLISVFTWIGNEVLLSRRGLKSDFFPLWYGTQAILRQSNPYSEETSEEIHQFLYPDPSIQREYKVHLAYPAYIAIALFPFGLLPYQPALLLWIGIQFPLLFISLHILRKFLGLEMRGIQSSLLFIAGSVGFLYPLISYTLGQMSILLLFLFVTTFYFLETRQPVWAGVTLALMAIRPDMLFIGTVASIVLTWNVKRDLKIFGISTIVVLIAINLITVLLIRFWYFDWINVLSYYSTSNPKTHWPLEHLPNAGTRIALIIAILGYLIWQIAQFLNTPLKNEKFLVISALITIYQLVTRMTGSYHMTLLLIPSLILLYLYSRYKLQWVMWVMLISPWVFWALFARSNPWLNQLLFPLSLLILQVIYVGINKIRQTAISMKAA